MHLLNRFRAISDLLNLFLFESFPISSQDIRTIDYKDPLRAVSKKKKDISTKNKFRNY